MQLSTMTTSARTFLFWFSSEYSNFRIKELESLFKIFQLDDAVFSSRRVNGPFVLLNFKDEDGPKKLMSRSVLAHACYELWGEGATKTEMDKEVIKNVEMMSPFLQNSFQIRVETFGKTMQHLEKVQLMNTLDYLPMEGKVDLKNPECSLHLILYYGLDSNRVSEEPVQWYFGRWIADGQRKLASLTSLKTRKFIGNTSMDPLLSLLMVNLATVQAYDIVIDPFVGTGSILVAAAAMGGHVLGSDIDYLTLHGKTKPSKALQVARAQGESIRANMIQYGLESKYLDVVVGDASRPIWKDQFRVDAIITDPPYGIRERSERLGSLKTSELGFKIKEEHLEKHIPAKRSYSLEDIFCDLMNFAVDRLKIGGRLVYWIPISRTDYDEGKLPKNPCLQLVGNTEQVLTSFGSRRLLVFEKTKEAAELCKTEMDGTALMYRFITFETDPEKKKSRKAEIFSGKYTKRGQLLPPYSAL